MTNLQELKNKIYEICPELWKVEDTDIYYPINLEAVLKAIGSNKKLGNEGLVINTRGDMCVLKINPDKSVVRKYPCKIVRWIFGKTLNDQNPKTINFLHNLICK
jgi:hypothetical protein